MPELPEVETIKNELSKKIIGKKIKDIEIFSESSINYKKDDFRKIAINLSINKIERRAKILIVELSDHYNFLIHLKLTGQLIYVEKNLEISKKHTQIIFHFSSGDHLLFNDLRKFGYVKLLKDEELKSYFINEKIGVEPLEGIFTLEKFKELLRNKRGKIKVALMDQKFIAGLGNIYSAEVCFYAYVNPNRIVSSLEEKEINLLFEGIKKILTEAIKYKGSSVDTYVDIYGEKGKFVPLLKVYGRKGKKCYRCGGIIKSISLGGRGTYFCPQCQK